MIFCWRLLCLLAPSARKPSAVALFKVLFDLLRRTFRAHFVPLSKQGVRSVVYRPVAVHNIQLRIPRSRPGPHPIRGVGADEDPGADRRPKLRSAADKRLTADNPAINR